jgi:anaphase-promoting complex subunit 11
MKVQIDNWFAVGTWNWDIVDPQCVVCMSPFEMPCPRCKYAGDDCAPI